MISLLGHGYLAMHINKNIAPDQKVTDETPRQADAFGRIPIVNFHGLAIPIAEAAGSGSDKLAR